MYLNLKHFGLQVSLKWYLFNRDTVISIVECEQTIFFFGFLFFIRQNFVMICAVQLIKNNKMPNMSN